MNDHYDRYNGMENLLGTNLAEVGTDCISKQQAIDALNSRKTAEQCEAGKTRNWTVDICVDMIKQLPPIQPEIVRCEECKYHYQRNCPIERYFSLNGFCSRGKRREVTT